MRLSEPKPKMINEVVDDPSFWATLDYLKPAPGPDTIVCNKVVYDYLQKNYFK